MTREQFEQTNYNGKITYETYQKCDCTMCQTEHCIHRDAYRRMPEDIGGLGLCPNLKTVDAPVFFSREWKQSDIKRIVKDNSYLKFGQHDDLKALCICPFAEDDDFYDADYQELIFIVPSNWLKEVAEEMFGVDDLDNWLQNEYTTDESEPLFERALNERKVVMVDFN